MKINIELPGLTPVISKNVVEVADNVWGVRDLFSNYYFIRSNTGPEWILVDCGVRKSDDHIMRMASALFGANAKPKAIVLTHGHFDHIGALQNLMTRWDVPVFAHELELPYLNGQSAYPPTDSDAGGGLLSTFSFMFPRGPFNFQNRILKFESDYFIEGFEEWSIIHTPGHSPGHVSLFREHDAVLIAGDCFLSTQAESAYHAVTYKERVSGPPRYFTYDWVQAKSSIEKLLALSPRVAGTGHGLPLTNPQLAFELQNLYDNFEVIAVPEEGRYSKEPAVTNRFGVASWPERPGLLSMAGKFIACSGLVLSATILAFQKMKD